MIDASLTSCTCNGSGVASLFQRHTVCTGIVTVEIHSNQVVYAAADEGLRPTTDAEVDLMADMIVTMETHINKTVCVDMTSGKPCNNSF